MKRTNPTRGRVGRPWHGERALKEGQARRPVNQHANHALADRAAWEDLEDRTRQRAKVKEGAGKASDPLPGRSRNSDRKVRAPQPRKVC